MYNLRSIISKLRSIHRGSNIKCFCREQDCDGIFKLTDRGVRIVPLKLIVGSVGKCLDFNSQFTLKGHVPPDRLIKIKQAMRQGKSFPPIKLYKIKNEYYVLDGNHRVAAAKEFGHFDIMAKIVEVIPSNNTNGIPIDNK